MRLLLINYDQILLLDLPIYATSLVLTIVKAGVVEPLKMQEDLLVMLILQILKVI